MGFFRWPWFINTCAIFWCKKCCQLQPDVWKIYCVVKRCILTKNLEKLKKKRDLKGFKCMTVSLDVFGDFPRLSNILWMVSIWFESFHYFVNHSIISWIIPIFCESFQYFVNRSNILGIFPTFWEFFQYFVNHSNRFNHNSSIFESYLKHLELFDSLPL